jgi:putative ABC transport system ATP-binding protein
MDNVLSFRDLCYYYENGGKRTTILDNANITFEKGKLYTILGPSGSGKTTTLALAGALDVPQSGEILFNGESLPKIGFTRYRSNKIGIVFQSYNLINYMNALQNVEMAMEITENKIENRKQKAYDLLGKVGLDRELVRRNVNKLSGGEQQRVAIARAISTDAELILADEPTGNLDSDTAQEIIKILVNLAHDDGKCVIVVTHSEDFANQADIIVRLKDGKLLQAETA